MISAKEAREIAETSISEESQAELAKIEAMIKQQSEKGECNVCFGKRFTMQTIRELGKAGYEVRESDDQRDGYTTYITW